MSIASIPVRLLKTFQSFRKGMGTEEGTEGQVEGKEEKGHRHPEEKILGSIPAAAALFLSALSSTCTSTARVKRRRRRRKDGEVRERE